MKIKSLRYVFWGLSVLLALIMCVVVSFNYKKMKLGIETNGYSAPASVAFLYAIPFIIAIAICVIIAIVIKRKR